MSELNKVAVAVGAHPDDVEFGCAGTLALLKEKGWQIHVATAARGDCGSAEYGREEISRIRAAESARAAALLDATFNCLGCDDVFIMYDRETIVRAIELLRKIRPLLVFAPSPSDYMADHEITSRVVQTACFCTGMPNIEIPGVESFEPVPYLYYVDAQDSVDILGNDLPPSMVVDITTTVDIKEQMLCCHESQRNWLLTHHGMDEYTMSMKRFAKQRGELIGVAYGEGFRQHLGHAFPRDNLLQSELGPSLHLL